MILQFAIVALFTLTLSTPLCAQWSPDLRAGARVRVRLPEREYQYMGPRGQSVRGTVVLLAPDTLFLRLGDSVGTVAIPRTHIRRLDVSRGIPSRVASAAGTGLFWGLALGLATALYPQREPATLSHWEEVAIGAGAGLAIGAVFGAIYPVERWKHVRLEPRLAPNDVGVIGVSVQLSW